MTSKSSEKVVTSNKQDIADNRNIIQSGQQIVDSIVMDNSPEVVEAALRPILSAWRTMVKSQDLNIAELGSMAGKVISMAERSQINISKTAMETLRIGAENLDLMMSQNRYYLDVSEGISDRAFDQSDSALELVADIKTGDFADLSKSIMLFALLALYITQRNK